MLLRRVGVIVGIGLLIWIVRSVGLEAIWQEFCRMGWRLLLILGFYWVIFALDTLGWYYSFTQGYNQASVGSLFLIRLAGEAINYVTPFAQMGGEPVKVLLLKQKHGIPVQEGFTSVVIAKTAITAGLFFFAACSAAAALLYGHLSSVFARVVWIVLISMGILTFLFVLAQRHGIFERAVPMLEKMMGARSVSIEGAGQEIDASIRNFYRSQRSRLFLSVLFHALGWAAGVVEVWLILHFLGLGVSFVQAWMIEGLWQLLKAGAFMIPGAIGAQEGSVLFIFLNMGLSSPAAVVLALVRRIREIFWAGIGLAVWSGYEYGSAKAL
ncbi:MAG: flippase-like domain-containing protein [Candidatus Omnitrophica bacterium]|nr:flippase-like domain-containing protein [Candidatus Omnitrophota bacterium]